MHVNCPAKCLKQNNQKIMDLLPVKCHLLHACVLKCLDFGALWCTYWALRFSIGRLKLRSVLPHGIIIYILFCHIQMSCYLFNIFI